jgi:hypothetical protein
MAKAQPLTQLDADQQRQLKILCMKNLLATAAERVYFKDALSRFIFVSAGWAAAYTRANRPPTWSAGRTSTSSPTSMPPLPGRTSSRSSPPGGRSSASWNGNVQEPAGRLGVNHQDAAAGRTGPDRRHVRYHP